MNLVIRDKITSVIVSRDIDVKRNPREPPIAVFGRIQEMFGNSINLLSDSLNYFNYKISRVSYSINTHIVVFT